MKYSFVITTLVIAVSAVADFNSEKPFGFEVFYQQGSPASLFKNSKTLVSVFPKDLYGPEHSGFNFGALLPLRNSATISYEVLFSKDFDFVKGGKLPGLCSGDAVGGNRANGVNGFSARLMWRKEGRLVSYVYHVNQVDKYGDDFQWFDANSKPIFFKRGIWHKIKMTVGVNDVDKSNGFIEGYFNGAKAFEKRDLTFRTIEKKKVSWLCFNTFFGGSDESWAPKKEEKLLIRNLVVTEKP